MNQNIKLLLVIIITFFITIATSMLLEIPLFKHWLRQSIVVLFVIIEIYFAYVIFNFISQN